MQNSLTGFFSLLVTSFLFGTYGVWIRIISSELSTYQQLVLRYGFGALLLFLVIRARKEKISLKKVPKIHLLLFSLSIPVTFVFF